MSINSTLSRMNLSDGSGAGNSDTAAAERIITPTLPDRIGSSVMQIPPTGSAMSLAGRVDPLCSAASFAPKPTPLEELLYSSLITEATGLKALISIQFAYTTPSDEPIFMLNTYDLICRLEGFLKNLHNMKDHEKTLDTILPKIHAEDKWILYKYLDKDRLQQIGPIADLTFKKVAENLKLDLSKIENLLPIFHHPIDQQEWTRLFPLLQSFASSIGVAPAGAASDISSYEVQALILTALDQAVKSKNLEAISFLLSNFPFLKSAEIAQEDLISLNFVDSNKMQQYNMFSNAFYSALTSGDVRSVEAFLAAGWDLRKKAGSKIIQNLLIEKRFTPNGQEKILTPGERSAQRGIFHLLLKYGLDPELIIEGTSGMPSTMGETLFLHNDPLVKQCGLYLFEHGAKLTPRVVEKIKLELREHPAYEEVIIRLLTLQGKASAEEIRCLAAPPAAMGSRDALLVAMSSAKITINKLLRRYTGNPLIEDFKELEDIRGLKKEVKKYLAAHPEDGSLRAVYESFSSGYDAIVTNHYILSKLRQVSQVLRGYIKPTSRPAGASAAHPRPSLSGRVITALFNLWHPVAGLISDGASQLISTLSTTTRSANFQIVRSNFLKYVALMNADGFWRDKQVTCFHGTKLVPDMVKETALIPAGMMGDDIEGAIVQFSGEQHGSKKIHNKEHISCVKPAKDWDDLENTNRLQKVPTPMLIAEVYAKQISGYGKVETGFDYEASRKRANWEYIANAVFGTLEISERALQHCYTDILRLRAWDPSHAEYLTPLLINIREALVSRTTSPWQRESLEELKQALTVKIKFPLDRSDRDLISRPIPIMFASTNFPPIPLQEVFPSAKHGDEVFFKGRAFFGKDLQAAFVSEEDLPRASSLLDRSGIRVFPFPIAHAIETDRMMRGAGIQERSQALASEQEKLGALLQEDILPSYGRPLAERPSYIDKTDVEHFVERPFWGREFPSYAAYKKAVEDTTAIPRFIHGKMHAVRTSMAAQLWANVYSAMKEEPVAPDRKLLAIAAAAHDAQRQDEGIDHWDGASGRALQSYLASRGYPKQICADYARALIEKDPTEIDASGRPVFTSDVQRLVHDADTLEIMRVLRDRKDFQSTRLAALAVWEECKKQTLAKVPTGNETAVAEAQRKISEIETDLQRVVQEWGDFIEMTEKPELKMLLEYTPSIDYYTQVLKILNYVTGKGALPTLKKFLGAELAQITGAPSDGIVRILEI